MSALLPKADTAIVDINVRPHPQLRVLRLGQSAHSLISSSSDRWRRSRPVTRNRRAVSA